MKDETVNKVMIYPGYILLESERTEKKFDGFEIGSSLITGIVGSGKTILCENILAQLIALYKPTEVDLRVWDGKGFEFVRLPKFYEGDKFVKMDKLDVCSKACCYLDETLMDCINSITEEVNKRIRKFKYYGCRNYDEFMRYTSESLPRVIYYLEEIDACIGPYVPDIFNDIQYVLRMGDIVGVHIIINTQHYKVFSGLQHFRYIMVTRLSAEGTEYLFGKDVADGIQYKRYGSVFIKTDDSISLTEYNVPFYPQDKVKEIVEGKIAPNGWVPDKKQREELRKFYKRA